MRRHAAILLAFATVACSDPPAPPTRVEEPPPPAPPAPFLYGLANGWDRPDPAEEITGLSVLWRTQLPRSCDVDHIARVEGVLMTCCDHDVFVLDPLSGEIRHRTTMSGACGVGTVITLPHGLLLGANVLEMSGDTPVSRGAYVTLIGTDGQPLWYTPLDVDRVEGVVSSGHALAVGRHVGVEGGQLFTIDVETGRILSTERTGYAMSGLARVGSHVLLFREGTPGLFEWRQPGTASLGDRIPTRAVVHGDHAILHTHSDLFAETRYEELEGRDAQSLEVRWTRRLGEDAAVAIDDDAAAVVDVARNHRTLVVLDGATGAERWHRALGTQDVFSVTVVGPFVVVEQAAAPSVYALADGRPLGHAALAPATPLIEGDRMFAAASREIVCFSIGAVR